MGELLQRKAKQAEVWQPAIVRTVITLSQVRPRSVIRPFRFVAENDHVVVQATGHNKTTSGTPYENQYCWVIRVRAGKIAELTEYADTQLIATVLQAPSASHDPSRPRETDAS